MHTEQKQNLPPNQKQNSSEINSIPDTSTSNAAKAIKEIKQVLAEFTKSQIDDEIKTEIVNSASDQKVLSSISKIIGKPTYEETLSNQTNAQKVLAKATPSEARNFWKNAGKAISWTTQRALILAAICVAAPAVLSMAGAASIGAGTVAAAGVFGSSGFGTFASLGIATLNTGVATAFSAGGGAALVQLVHTINRMQHENEVSNNQKVKNKTGNDKSELNSQQAQSEISHGAKETSTGESTTKKQSSDTKPNETSNNNRPEDQNLVAESKNNVQSKKSESKNKSETATPNTENNATIKNLNEGLVKIGDPEDFYNINLEAKQRLKRSKKILESDINKLKAMYGAKSLFKAMIARRLSISEINSQTNILKIKMSLPGHQDKVIQLFEEKIDVKISDLNQKIKSSNNSEVQKSAKDEIKKLEEWTNEQKTKLLIDFDLINVRLGQIVDAQKNIESDKSKIDADKKLTNEVAALASNLSKEKPLTKEQKKDRSVDKRFCSRTARILQKERMVLRTSNSSKYELCKRQYDVQNYNY